MRRVALSTVLVLASCKSCDAPPTRPEFDAARPSAEPAGPEAGAPSDGAAVPADGGRPTASVADDPAESDAGVSPCRLVYGPAEQPFRGPAALAVAGQELHLVANDMGKPRIFPVPIGPAGRGVAVPPKPATFVPMRWPPCELAGRFAYCPASGGAILRTALAGGDSKTIAKGRTGTRIAAAPIGPDHAVVAFLDVRHTTEGDMLQAFVVLDERDPVRLSEDGAGATTLRFLSRGDSPVAVYLDTRTAMVPVHARPVTIKGDGLALGADAVIFVGGAPERGIDFTLGSTGAKSFVFIPMPREVSDFGMATLVVEDPPKDDVPATWSRYPNGLDPAPVAAAPSRDGKSVYVARVRPRGKEPGSPRIVELGRVDAQGAFTSHGEIAPGRGVTDMAVVDDGAGVWILYGDTTSTWLERRVCGG